MNKERAIHVPAIIVALLLASACSADIDSRPVPQTELTVAVDESGTAAVHAITVPDTPANVDEAIATSLFVAQERYSALAAARAPDSTNPFFCYTNTLGFWENKQLKSWCSGFSAGAFWFLHAMTGEPSWSERAQAWTTVVAPAATPRPSNGYPQNGDQDTGFQIYGSFGLGLLFEPSVDTTEYEGRVLEGAASLMTDRYNPNIGAFRAWPQTEVDPLLVGNSPGQDAPNAFEVNIDMMMNVELVLAAADLLERDGDTDKAATYRDASRSHFLRSYDGLVRTDGSSFHVVQFDPEGTIINQRTHQGAADDTTWSRGHAWATYGHAMMHRRLGDEIWRTRADELIDYYTEQTASAVPPTDFDRAAPEDTRDSSAAAITCSALMDLHITSEEDVTSGRYISAARGILTTLAGSKYLTGGPATQESLLWSCTEKYGPAEEDPELGCSFGDYYFLECMHRYVEATTAP